MSSVPCTDTPRRRALRPRQGTLGARQFATIQTKAVCNRTARRLWTSRVVPRSALHAPGPHAAPHPSYATYTSQVTLMQTTHRCVCPLTLAALGDRC